MNYSITRSFGGLERRAIVQELIIFHSLKKPYIPMILTLVELFYPLRNKVPEPADDI